MNQGFNTVPASQSGMSSIWIVLIVCVILIFIGGGIGLTLWLSRRGDEGDIKCTKDSDCVSGNICKENICVTGCRVNSDCGTGKVCTGMICVDDTGSGRGGSGSTENVNTGGGGSGNAFVTSLTNGCYIADGKTYSIKDSNVCYVQQENHIEDICTGGTTSASLNSITGGVAWDDPNSTISACPVPEDITPTELNKKLCVGVAYVPQRYKIAESDNCEDDEGFSHLYNIKAAEMHENNPTFLTPYCVGKATNPVRYKIAPGENCGDSTFTHQFAFKVPSEQIPNVATKELCTGFASAPERYIVYNDPTKCGSWGWTERTKFFTEIADNTP